jgi:acyl-CoA thioesterase
MLLTARHIVFNKMLAHDAFSQWLGIEVLEVEPGRVSLTMTVREDMLNGFGIAHGGITYSLADSALAFASNGHGYQCVSVQTDIRHLKPVSAGDVLHALATEDHLGKTMGHYRVEIRRGEDLVALFQGMVYRTGKPWTE